MHSHGTFRLTPVATDPAVHRCKKMSPVRSADRTQRTGRRNRGKSAGDNRDINKSATLVGEVLESVSRADDAASNNGMSPARRLVITSRLLLPLAILQHAYEPCFHAVGPVQ